MNESEVEELARWLHERFREYGPDPLGLDLCEWQLACDDFKGRVRFVAGELLTNPPACLLPAPIVVDSQGEPK